MVYIDILTSPDAPPLPSRVGGRLPAHVTGVGKAMLAYSPPETVRAVLDGGLPRVSPQHGRAGPAGQGASRDPRDRCCLRPRGVRAWHRVRSQPRRRRGRRVLGALSVSGWSTRVRLDHVAPAVRTAALSLSRTLGHRAPGGAHPESSDGKGLTSCSWAGWLRACQVEVVRVAAADQAGRSVPRHPTSSRNPRSAARSKPGRKYGRCRAVVAGGGNRAEDDVKKRRAPVPAAHPKPGQLSAGWRLRVPAAPVPRKLGCLGTVHPELLAGRQHR